MEQHNSPSAGGTIAFIHLLRGIAPLLVLWSHLTAWWLSEAHRTSPLLEGWTRYVATPLRLYQNGGHLGVLLFFLVSGFVITHVSLRETAPEFFVKRLFRLAPVMLLALGMLPELARLGREIGVPGPMGNQSPRYFAGFFFLNYFQGGPQVLTVLWTLFVEALFYAGTLLTIRLSRTHPLTGTWAILALCHALNIMAGFCPTLVPSMWGLMYVPYLLIGRCVYLGWARLVPTVQVWAAGAACYGSFLLIYARTSPGLLEQPNGPMVSQLIALVCFLALAFSGLQRIPRALGFCADISYSLYLLHAPLGAFLLYLLTLKVGLSYEFSLPLVIVTLLLVCQLVYRLVEIPSQDAARQLVRRWHLGREPNTTSTGKDQPRYSLAN